MSTLTSLLSVALVAAQEGPAPEDVKAGWLGFAVWIGLAAAVVFLSFSLRKHLKRVNFDEGPDAPDGRQGPHGTDGAGGRNGTGGPREPRESAG